MEVGQSEITAFKSDMAFCYANALLTFGRDRGDYTAAMEGTEWDGWRSPQVRSSSGVKGNDHLPTLQGVIQCNPGY